MRLSVAASVTVWAYSCRMTRSQSKVPRCRDRGPSRGTSIAITGPVQAAIVNSRGMPVIRTANRG